MRSIASSDHVRRLNQRVTEGPVNAASAFVYKSRTRNEPTQATMPQWAAAFWARLESLITDLGSICIKVRSNEARRMESLALTPRCVGLHPREGPQAQEGPDDAGELPGRSDGRAHSPLLLLRATLTLLAQVLDNKPSVLFWTSLAQAFETQAKEAARCA